MGIIQNLSVVGARPRGAAAKMKSVPVAQRPFRGLAAPRVGGRDGLGGPEFAFPADTLSRWRFGFLSPPQGGPEPQVVVQEVQEAFRGAPRGRGRRGAVDRTGPSHLPPVHR